jgi:D-glycero-D-manno-heptose 1,7-bisphosphate phosphatase
MGKIHTIDGSPGGQEMLKQAVFLVGGLGTRLKDRTRTIPKPLLAIGGRPFLDYPIE